jgi:hypothetical protein
VPFVYELFLRPPPGTIPDAAQLAAALTDLEPGVRGELIPAAAAGEASVAPQGLDLGLEAGAPIERLLDAAFRVAGALDLEVFDPQGSEVVTAAGRDRVEARYAEMCSYRADTLGEVGSLPVLPLPAATPGGRTRLHLWLIVAGLVLAFLLLARGCRWLL